MSDCLQCGEPYGTGDYIPFCGGCLGGRGIDDELRHKLPGTVEYRKAKQDDDTEPEPTQEQTGLDQFTA